MRLKSHPAAAVQIALGCSSVGKVPASELLDNDVY